MKHACCTKTDLFMASAIEAAVSAAARRRARANSSRMPETL